jgi:hypothetical protein
LRLPFAQVRLAHSRVLWRALRHGSSVSTFCQRAVVSVRRSLRRRVGTPTGCAATAHRQCSGTSNEGLSKITGHRQIVETGASSPVATTCGGETASVAARDWAAIEARDRMERVSQGPLLPMQHITPVLRVAAFGRWPPRAG